MSARGASGELGDDFCDVIDVWKPLANFKKLSLRDFLSVSVDFKSGDFDLESGVVPLPNIPVMVCMNVLLDWDALLPVDFFAGEFEFEMSELLRIPSMLSISLDVDEI